MGIFARAAMLTEKVGALAAGGGVARPVRCRADAEQQQQPTSRSFLFGFMLPSPRLEATPSIGIHTAASTGNVTVIADLIRCEGAFPPIVMHSKARPELTIRKWNCKRPGRARTSTR